MSKHKKRYLNTIKPLWSAISYDWIKQYSEFSKAQLGREIGHSCPISLPNEEIHAQIQNLLKEFFFSLHSPLRNSASAMSAFT